MMDRTKSAIVFWVAFLLLLTATISLSAETPKKGGDLKAIGTQYPVHFNSAIQSGIASMQPGGQIFSSLVDFDDKWQPIPNLAKNWEISKDGLTYTFRLFDKATFHDGKPVTSEDVAFSLNTVKKNHPFGVAMFAAVDRVETPDRHTAIFKLRNPHPALLLALSPPLMPVIPKHIYNEEQHGPIRQNPANLKPIGSGPFKFAESKPGEYYILERNEKYFRPGVPYLDRIIVRLIRDPNAAMIALQQGDFHIASFSAGIRLKDLSRLKKVDHLIITGKGYEAIGPINYLEFNLRKKPFNDIRVRQAIAHSIDQNFIVQTLQQGFTEVLTGPLHKESPFYFGDVKKHELNLEKANKLLDEAGYPRKSDGVRFSATLDWYPGSYDNQQLIAEYLKPQLRKIGIDVQLRPPPDFGTWVKRVSSWEYDLTVNAYFSYGDPVIGVHRIYLCDNIKNIIWTNTQGWCNQKADEILKQAAIEADQNKRKNLYAEFQKIVAEDVPLIYTHKQPHFTIHHKDLSNVVPGIWGVLSPMNHIYWKEGREPK